MSVSEGGVKAFLYRGVSFLDVPDSKRQEARVLALFDKFQRQGVQDLYAFALDSGSTQVLPDGVDEGRSGETTLGDTGDISGEGCLTGLTGYTDLPDYGSLCRPRSTTEGPWMGGVKGSGLWGRVSELGAHPSFRWWGVGRGAHVLLGTLSRLPTDTGALPCTERSVPGFRGRGWGSEVGGRLLLDFTHYSGGVLGLFPPFRSNSLC